MAYIIQLKQFEGPLDLLLHLISRAQIDICDIFISEITEQYLEAMGDVASLDMDTASEFLAMAATLLEIKSRALLPRPPEPEEEGEETPEQALIRRLTEYRLYKESAGQMKDFERAAQAVFSKLPEEYPLPPQTYQLEGLTLEGLAAAIERILARVELRNAPAPSVRSIARDSYSIEECVARISQRMRSGPAYFTELFSEHPCRDEVITLFMALLELLRLGRLHIEQQHVFDDILLLPGRRETHGAG